MAGKSTGRPRKCGVRGFNGIEYEHGSGRKPRWRVVVRENGKVLFRSKFRTLDEALDAREKAEDLKQD